MIPVAGRRRGVAPSNSSAPAGDGAATSLFGGGAPASTLAAPPPAPSGDALSFLDFDDDVAPPATSAPVASNMPPQSVPHRAQNVPSFLDFDDDIPVPTHKPSEPSTTVSLQTTARWKELQDELQRVQNECVNCEESIRKLEGGDDEACIEVRALDEQLRSKQEEEVMAAAVQKDLEKCLEMRREQLTEENRAKGRLELVKATNAMREQFENELSALCAHVEQQRASLLVVEEKHSAMGEAINSVELYEQAVGQLQERLKATLRDVSTALCLRIKPSLTNCIRDTVAAFAQERLGMLSNDRRRRQERLEGLKQNVDKGFSLFVEERRAKHQSRVDSIFGGEKFRFQAEVEQRLAASRAKFMEQQNCFAAEAKRSALIAFEEITRRAAADLEAFQRKMKEELKLTAERYATELAHIARLQTAERDAVLRPRGEYRSRDTGLDAGPPSVLKAIENDTRYILERVEQIRQSISLDMQDLSIASQKPRCESLAALGKERMLAELEEKVRSISRQFTGQWQRFKSAVGPLHQCVQLMARGVQDGRVKAAVQQEGAECVYRDWTQSVRRELSRCLIGGGAPSECAELQSGMSFLARVVEMVRVRAHAILEAQRRHSQMLRGVGAEVRQGLAQLSEQRVASNSALCSVFDEYESLSQAAVELEAKRMALEVATENYDSASRMLQRKRATLDEKLKVAQELSAKLRHNSEKLERKMERHQQVHFLGNPRLVQDVAMGNLLRGNVQSDKKAKCGKCCSYTHSHAPRVARQRQDETSPASGGSDGTSPLSNGEETFDFVTLLSFDDATSHTVTHSDSSKLKHKWRAEKLGCTNLFEPSSCESDVTCCTTPSTLN